MYYYCIDASYYFDIVKYYLVRILWDQVSNLIMLNLSAVAADEIGYDVKS